MLYRWADGAKWWRICFGGRWGARSFGNTKQQLGDAASCLDAGHCFVAESSVSVGAAAAELPLEGCCIDGRTAQKWWRICFVASWDACSIWNTEQELGGAPSWPDAGKCCVAESCVGAGAAAAELPLERRFVDTRCAQKWRRICFGGSCGVRSIGDARQQLCIAAPCLDAGKCCVAGSEQRESWCCGR